MDSYTGGALASNRKFFLGSYMGTSFLTADFIGSRVGIIRSLVYIGTGSRGYLYAGGSTGEVQVEQVRPSDDATLRGRTSWREIVK